MESDDKKIEKKDKNVDEPVQFYTGKDKLLYELVINTGRQGPRSRLPGNPKERAPRHQLKRGERNVPLLNSKSKPKDCR